MKVKNLPKLIFSIFICLGAGFLGSIFTTPAISSWYTTLQKPTFSPPNWVFAPVWTTLFLLMGVALYLVWINKLAKKMVQAGLTIFALQLVANVLWSILFFGLKSPSLALIEIAILWVLIAATIKIFYKINKSAGYLLVPYLLWVSFASVLNYQIWLLNESTTTLRSGIFS